ncbi:MAG: iron ABC transporter permease [Aureispira sp.]|nr:iron ABC transporter permease [Aureispira sp.]
MLIFLLVILNIALGSVSIPLEEIIYSLLGISDEGLWDDIVWKFRLPKVLTTIVAGGSLALSGLLMQTFFRNPIAGPFVLGISSGASLGVALLILAVGWLGQYALFSAILESSWALVIMASFGASTVLFLLLLVARRIKDVSTLLILGLMFGSATSAVVSLLQYFSSQQALQNFVLWSMGNLNGVTWAELKLLLPLNILVWFAVIGLAKSLDALLLGEEYAQSMGVNVQKTRTLIIGATSILAGSITAFCGPIAFVGIAIPHLARMLFRVHQHRLLVLGTALLGILTLLACQLVAQLPGSDQQLPINVVTSFLGAPMVIWIVLRGQKI